MTDPHDTIHAASSPSESLPEGWVATSLGDVILKIVGGGTPSKSRPDYFLGDIPFMTVKDMKTRFPAATQDHISVDAVRSSATNLIEADTLIIATRMALGKIARPKMTVAINQDLKALYFSEDVAKTFFEYWWKSSLANVEALGTGTTVQGIRIDDITNLDFPLPPLPEQIRIADKLDALLSRVEAGRERLERVPGLLKRFRQSVLSAAMSGELTREWRGSGDDTVEIDSTEFDFIDQPILLPLSWAVKILGKIATKVQDGNYGGDYPKEDEWKEDGIPFVTGAALGDSGQIVLSKLRYVSVEKNDLLKKAQTLPDDVIFPNRGAKDSQKSGAEPIAYLVPAIFPEWNINPQITLIRSNAEVSPLYLKHALNSPFFLRQHSIATSGSALAFINLSKTKAIALPIPTFPEQAEIVRRVEALFAIADRIEARYQLALITFNRLTPALLAKAFRGELVAQDPNDEPASVLLERIRAQRAATGEKLKRGRGAAKGAARGADTSDGTEPKRRGRPPRAQAEADAIPRASNYEDAVRRLEAQKAAAVRQDGTERALGTRQESLFESAEVEVKP